MIICLACALAIAIQCCSCGNPRVVGRTIFCISFKCILQQQQLTSKHIAHCSELLNLFKMLFVKLIRLITTVHAVIEVSVVDLAKNQWVSSKTTKSMVFPELNYPYPAVTYAAAKHQGHIF